MTSPTCLSESFRHSRKLKSFKSLSSFSTTFSSSNQPAFDSFYDKHSFQNKSISKDLQTLFTPSQISLQSSRASFYSSLVYKNIMKKPSTHNTIFLYDWDDTLFCTSYLFPNGIHDDESIRSALKLIDKMTILQELVYNLLFMSINKGKVYIVTNSSPGWVQKCIRKFYPKLQTLMNSITVISARGKFSQMYPEDMQMWKILTFEEIAEEYDSNLVSNIICMGDDDIEMEACELMVHKFREAVIKTIKFKEKPSFNELKKTLKLVCGEFKKIYTSIKSLTINVSKGKK